MNAVRQWSIPRLPRAERIERYLAAFQFIADHYFVPDAESDFDPQFYKSPPRPMGEGHYALLTGWGSERLSVGACPRGYGKSTLNYTDMAMRLVSSPGYSFIYATSSLKNIQLCSSILRTQFAENARLIDDFGPEYGGSIVPPRNSGRVFGSEYFELANGSYCSLYSAKSKLRGGRPKCFVLDDPEYDPDAETSMAMIRRYMERLIFKIIMPMVTMPNTQVRWIGTFLSKQHYLWKAMGRSDGDDALRDTRFDRWYRIFVPSEYDNAEGVRVSAWPSVWPLTEEQKQEAAKIDPYFEEAVSLEEMRETMGSAVYSSEMMGKPGESEDRYFAPLSTQQHGYWFEEIDHNLSSNPLASNSKICFYTHDSDRGEWVLNRLSFKYFLAKSRLFMTVDTSYTAESHSDFKVATLMGYYPGNLLFVLDMWAGRTKPQILVEQAFTMAEKWKCPSIHVEHIKDGILVYNSLQSKAATAAKDSMGYTHVPRIMKIKPGMQSKEGKIDAAMTMRMELGAIKMPLFLRTKKPWRDLFDQIDEFNPEAADCFVAGTLIETDRGSVPIEEVTTGDRVLTRYGYQKVLKAWKTGERMVGDFRLWRCTFDHPVWTENRGWVPANQIKNDDVVLVCQPKESPSTDVPILGQKVEDTSPQPKPYTEMCGNTIMEPSPKGLSSTTKITIRATTVSKILNSCETEITGVTTRTIDETRRLAALEIGLPFQSPVLVEKSSSGVTTSEPDIALKNASTSTGSSRTDKRIENDLQSTLVNVAVEPTWNLQVQNHPEFFANGVLVHNCGLEHDDHLDTVAMHMYVLKARLIQSYDAADLPSKPLDRLRRGETLMEDGKTPIAMGIDIRQLTLGDIVDIIAARQSRQDEQKESPL